MSSVASSYALSMLLTSASSCASSVPLTLVLLLSSLMASSSYVLFVLEKVFRVDGPENDKQDSINPGIPKVFL